LPGLILLALACAVLWWAWCSVERRDIWSIGIYAGDSPFSLCPHPSVGAQPVLSAADITGVPARFVADPFLVREGDRWHMFFEILEAATDRGVIGVASSEDGRTWRYQRVVLREAFHLSYPYVFLCNGTYYMLPESGFAAAIRLYRAVEFPYRWEFERELLRGVYWDPSIIQRDGVWWLFAQDDKASLTLHYASELRGPWVAHPQSPVVAGSINISRPGGRLIDYRGSIVRYTQDGEPTYGSRLRAFQVDELTTTAYREHEAADSPVLSGTGRGWNKTGMHHADAHRLADGRWIASVDGNRQRLRLNWRAGARRILNGRV
jgi:hypothetical protein